MNNTDINPMKPIEFVIEVKSLEGFKMTGVGHIEAKNIQAKHMTIALTGVGDITIEGAGDAVLNVSDSRSVREASLRRQTLRERLDVSVSGVGSVEYIGSPKVQKSGKGLGQVKQRTIAPN